jgi:hypothetical protein
LITAWFALLVQLLIEIALINLEAGDIRRFSEGEVAVGACLFCCRPEVTSIFDNLDS